jgi:hypothetical protein
MNMIDQLKSRVAASVLAGLLGLGASTAAMAFDSPFAGTWTMDVAKSHVTGDTFTYNKTATGYAYSNGGPVSYQFALDGNDYPTIPSESIACTETTPTSMVCVHKASGKIVSSGSRTLSADGSRYKTDFSVYRPDGTTGHEEEVFVRISGGPGFAGTWKDESAKFTPSAWVIATPTATTFQMTRPSDKSSTAGATDGTPSPLMGPTVPPGATNSVLATSPTTWSYTIMLQGKVYAKGMMSVSADGKTLTDTSWVPGKESEKEVDVYTKS